MNEEELKDLLELAENYFLKHYPGKQRYTDRIISTVSKKLKSGFDPSRSKAEPFVIRLVKNAWADIYKIHSTKYETLTDPNILDGSEFNDTFEEYADAVDNWDPPTDIQNENQNISDISDTVYQEDELTDWIDLKCNRYMIAYGKLQIALHHINGEPYDILNTQAATITSLDYASKHLYHFAPMRLQNNIDYYKLKAWFDVGHTRRFQEMALGQMIIQQRLMDELYQDYLRSEDASSKIEMPRHFPLAGAVLVDANGSVLSLAHSGAARPAQKGSIKEHSEFILLNNLMSEHKDTEAIGGTLYLTMEPCSSWSYDPVPCSVRCLEMGIRNIYIGTLDKKKGNNGTGLDVLKNGQYVFMKEDRFFVSEQGKALRQHFLDKKYETFENDVLLRVTIAPPVKVFPFYPDLTLEIVKRNSHYFM